MRDLLAALYVREALLGMALAVAGGGAVFTLGQVMANAAERGTALSPYGPNPVPGFVASRFNRLSQGEQP